MNAGSIPTIKNAIRSFSAEEAGAVREGVSRLSTSQEVRDFILRSTGREEPEMLPFAVYRDPVMGSLGCHEAMMSK